MRIFTRKPVLLYSYLATEMLAPFFAAFVIMNGVFFLVKLIPFLNFALELSIGLGDFIRLFSYMFPNMFLYTIPMASMMAVIIGFSRLSNDTEILALKASGISMYHIIPPVLVISAVIAVFTSYFSIKLIPVSEIAMKQLTYQLLKEKVDKGIKEQQFTEALGDLVVHVGRIDKESGDWSDVWVSDMRGQVNPTITMARSGRMKSDLDRMMVTIVLNHGSLHRPDKKDAQIVTFEKYTINIPLQPPAKGVNSVHRGTLSMPQLIEKSYEYGRDTKRGRGMMIEYHERLVLPVGCLILSILGLPLGLQAGPGKKAIGIPIGLGIFILYYILFTMSKMLAKEGVYAVAPMMWFPNTFFLLTAIVWVYRVSNEKSLLPEFIHVGFGKLYSLTIAPLVKLAGGAFALLAAITTRGFKKASRRQRVSAPRLTIKGDVKNHLFHFPACEQYNCEHCTVDFKNLKVALESGFTPCEFCKTLCKSQDEN